MNKGDAGPLSGWMAYTEHRDKPNCEAQNSFGPIVMGELNGLEADNSIETNEECTRMNTPI